MKMNHKKKQRYIYKNFYIYKLLPTKILFDCCFKSLLTTTAARGKRQISFHDFFHKHFFMSPEKAKEIIEKSNTHTHTQI